MGYTYYLLVFSCIINIMCNVSIGIDDYKGILFPTNVTNYRHSRSLTVRGVNADPQCVKCKGLSYCSIINNLMVEEVYITKSYASAAEIAAKGTCTVFEALGQRMYNEIFGVGKTFRDDSQCRTMVMQYLCLYWSSNNDMYRNSCINKEDVSSPDPTEHLLAPRPPCRSFCTQLALVCANEYDFLGVCSEIDCPPTADTCTPDPVLNGIVLSAGWACDIPIYSDPYSSSNKIFPALALIICVIIWQFYLFY